MKAFCTAAVLTVFLATGVSAAEPEGSPAPAAEKMICKTERVTGSLARRKRTCLTQEGWDDRNRRSQEALDRMRGSAGKNGTMDRDPYGGFTDRGATPGGPAGF